MSRCPRLAFYNYRLARAPRAKSWPIQFGNGYHGYRDILERAYIEACVKQEKELTEKIAGQLHSLAFSKAVDNVEWEDPPIEHKKSYLDLTRLRKTCEAALDSWFNEKKGKFYTVLSTEAPFEIPLPRRVCPSCRTWVEDDECPNNCGPTEIRLFSGKIDQILEWNNRLWVRDFKTTGLKRSDWKAFYTPRHQFTGYTWAAQQTSGRRMEGVIVDVVYNVKTKGPEFYPTLATRTAGDIRHWRNWAEDKWDEWERRCESGMWVMQTTACNDYGGCFFKDACNTGSWSDIERFLEEKTIHSIWDPLEPDLEEGLPE